MCNCGKKRNEFVQLPAQEIIASRDNLTVQTSRSVNFEYTGKTALTVVGSVTRNYYRFNKPGDKLLIDSNDAVSMMSVPVLKRIINS